MTNTPSMNGAASEIEDPMLLFARIGYRVYLGWRDGLKAEEFYKGYNTAELRRLAELRGESKLQETNQGAVAREQ